MPIVVSGSGSESGASGVTLNELIERVREAAKDRPHRDELNGAITSSATSITFASGVEIAAQQLVNIDFEVVKVESKTSTTVAVVVRGWDGSTGQASGDGQSVLVGYRFSDNQYRRAINESLAAIGYAFGRPRWYEAGAFSNDRLLAVPNTAHDVFMVAENPLSANAMLRPIPFQYMRSVPTSLVSTGKAVKLTGYNPGSGTAYVGYTTRWTKLVNRIDVLDAEYPNDAIDLIEQGALAYLLDSDTFMRAAFGEPHVVQAGRALSRVSEVRLAAAHATQKFLTRRTELASRNREQQFAWIHV